MIAVSVSSLKNFMSRLLTSDTFDSFLLEEAVIRTANTFTIDGRVNKEFFRDSVGEDGSTDSEPMTEFRSWSELRGLCFDLIKGKRVPLNFHFVLQLPPEKAAALLRKEGCSEVQAVKALVLNIRYDGAKAQLTTGTSYHSFTLSKEADVIWDKALLKFLSLKGIEYEEQ